MFTPFLESGKCAGTEEKSGVIDGARTRDNQNHNLGLYQLSYDHRYRRAKRLSQPRHIAKRKIDSIDQIILQVWLVPTNQVRLTLSPLANPAHSTEFPLPPSHSLAIAAHHLFSF